MEEYIYLHINNGGISMSIEKHIDQYFNTSDSYTTPLFVIKSTHFGNQTNQMKLHLDSEQLKIIGEWMISESKKIQKWDNVLESDIELSIEKEKNK